MKNQILLRAKDPRFKQMSEIGKKARPSTKGGSLHTSGAQSQGSMRRKLEKELGIESISSSFGGFTTNLTRRNRGMPLTQEQAERVWLDLIGGSSLSSSYDDESMKKNLAMEQKIAELSSQVEDSWARERRRDVEYEGLKAQLDALLASGGIPPCSNDVTFPPRRLNLLDIQFMVNKEILHMSLVVMKKMKIMWQTHYRISEV
ncbi:hypothetical protein H5410_022776 [Solanum commersonii]|uniref:Uncharacterized protein n=1 Tax=Solanum commersonii TaxID=4109 RepID=A0A9J5ZHR7_SOLCO|nr:hypothetical protein H5410_022776 [Solanum commersonii]